MKETNTVTVYRFESESGDGIFGAGVNLYYHASQINPDIDFNNDDTCPNPNNELELFVYKGSRKIRFA